MKSGCLDISHALESLLSKDLSKSQIPGQFLTWQSRRKVSRAPGSCERNHSKWWPDPGALSHAGGESRVSPAVPMTVARCWRAAPTTSSGQVSRARRAGSHILLKAVSVGALES